MRLEIIKNIFEWVINHMNYIYPIITAVISGFISYILSRKSTKNDLEKSKKENIFQTKRVTVIKSLNFIDNYLSCLYFDSGIMAVRDPEITTESLTLEARKIYNELSNTCEDENVPQLFSSILFDKNPNVLEDYNKYRNICRKEIGLKEIALDNDKIFFSQVSTELLSKSKK